MVEPSFLNVAGWNPPTIEAATSRRGPRPCPGSDSMVRGGMVRSSLNEGRSSAEQISTKAVGPPRLLEGRLSFWGVFAEPRFGV